MKSRQCGSTGAFYARAWRALSGIEFTFQPADLTAKILNFGSPSPIDVQINGPEMYANYEFARKLLGKFREIPGASDVVIQQTMRTPTLLVEGNRTFGLGVEQGPRKTSADNLLVTTAGSQQVDQKYWLDREYRHVIPDQCLYPAVADHEHQ